MGRCAWDIYGLDEGGVTEANIHDFLQAYDGAFRETGRGDVALYWLVDGKACKAYGSTEAEAVENARRFIEALGAD